MKEAKEKTILIIEDNEDTREIVKRALVPKGYEVISCESCIEVFKIIENKKNNINLIILDLMLPWLDGYDFMQKLKLNDNYKEIPILILSARTSEEDIEKGYALGCVKYITKPFMIEDIIESVEYSIA